MPERIFDIGDINREPSLVRVAFQGLEPVTPQDNGVWAVLARYGNFQNEKLASGEKVTVLPTCTVPIAYFARETWQKAIHMGNFRGVKAVYGLADGADPRIVVKSPERVFTKERRLLEEGYPWWGGERSGERRIYIPDNPVVEEQAVWEAITLLELRRQGVRAEIPQALIESLDGERALVVNKITSGDRSNPDAAKNQGPTYAQIVEHIKTGTSLVPEDLYPHNCLWDEEGYTIIIDVNRWAYPPYTDDFRQRLIQVIAQAR